MKLLKQLYFGIALMMVFFLSSCSKDSTENFVLAYDKYPIAFSTRLEGLTATRATSGNVWTGGEKIAIQIDNEVKQYQSAENGDLSSVGNKSPFYWTNQEMYVTAWHSSQYSNIRPTTFSVLADQSKSGYQASDFIYASQAITFDKTGECNLSFKHLPVKIVLNLTNGEGVSMEDVANAKVSIVNQNLKSSVIAEDWSITQAKLGNSTIIPNTAIQPQAKYQLTVQALLIPQNMLDQKFIKVSIGKGVDARDYYYIPTGKDADLKSGKQYTYNIIVKKRTLEVDVSSSTWNDILIEDNIKAELRIHLNKINVPLNTSDYIIKDANGTKLTMINGTYQIQTNAISISLSANNGYAITKFLTQLTKGICKIKALYDATTRTYIYTIYDIYSDLWLNIEAEAQRLPINTVAPQVGDYYYVDGTWSSTLLKPCIGIVFKVGIGVGDAKSNYESILKDNIRGYVVALTDAHNSTGTWGIRPVSAGLTHENNYVNKFDGYNNTVAVRKLESYQQTNINNTTANGLYWAFKVASEYDIAVPKNTSGWYLPSVGQLNEIYHIQNRSNIFKTAGGADFRTFENKGGYWSSTEYSQWDAWYYKFNVENGGPSRSAKSDAEFLHPCFVRSILTF